MNEWKYWVVDIADGEATEEAPGSFVPSAGAAERDASATKMAQLFPPGS